MKLSCDSAPFFLLSFDQTSADVPQCLLGLLLIGNVAGIPDQPCERAILIETGRGHVQDPAILSVGSAQPEFDGKSSLVLDRLTELTRHFLQIVFVNLPRPVANEIGLGLG